MTDFARIENGVVVELFSTDGDIAEMFHPDLVWVDCTATPGIAEGWLYSGDVFSAPATPQGASLPNINGFIQDLKSALGGIVAANNLAVHYPLFFAAVQSSEWADVQVLILDAHASTKISDAQYSSIALAATTNSIPITL